jgi:hypothetical protein
MKPGVGIVDSSEFEKSFFVRTAKRRVLSLPLEMKIWRSFMLAAY